MKLIVGLGNPGKQYEGTRHNIGFLVVDNYAKKNNLIFSSKLNGLYAETSINNEKVIFLKPQQFINLSGEVIKKYIDYFKIKIEDLLVINDDLDMEVGKYKLKSQGSSGGHNGLKNIELLLKTDEYKRFKIGISNNKNIETRDYVLGKISSEEKEIFNKIIDLSESIINDFTILDFDKLMNKYNHKN